MKENYTYPVIVDRTDPGYLCIIFPGFDGGSPDIPVMTSVKEGDDFISAAQDQLALEIAEYESVGRELPPENMKVDLEDGQQLVYVNLWMPYHRSTIKETYVKKTLTIPALLDILAMQQNVNFSAVLVAGLKEVLGLSRNPSDSEKQVICADFGGKGRP